MAEVDDVQHAEDQREADSGKRIDAAQHQAIGQVCAMRFMMLESSQGRGMIAPLIS